MKNVFRKSSTLFLLLLISLLYFGCSKERIQEPTINQYSPVSTYLDTKKQPEQEFIVDSSTTGAIVGNQGTKISIGKQCLMYPNGDSVTWPFTVKLVELYKPKDMIYYQMPTVASGNILETDGEIRLRAFKNDTELVLKPSPCFFQIEMPNAAPKNYMRVFYGFDSNARPNWTDNPSTLGVITSLSPVFSTTASSYVASIAKLGWINCGVLATNNPGSTLTFTSSTDDLTNVGIFIYLPATKTVMQVYNLTSDLIPNGASATIIAIAVDANGQLFSSNTTQVISGSAQVDVVLGPVSDATLTAFLDAL